jgi:hypothetical protein
VTPLGWRQRRRSVVIFDTVLLENLVDIGKVDVLIIMLLICIFPGGEVQALIAHRGRDPVAGHVLFGSDGLTSATVSVIGGLLVGHVGGERSGSIFVRGLGRAVGLGIVGVLSGFGLGIVPCQLHDSS